MTTPPSLERLLGDVLDQELERDGASPDPRARAEAQRELRARLPGGPGAAIACAEVEQALARALRAAGEPAPAVASVLRIGEVLDGKYEVEALLAEGGFGRVYRARDRALDCPVAIKILKADAGRAPFAELEEEARRLTRLRHPNIVEWKTLNRSADGRLYLVMEYLEGERLEEVLRREGRLAPERVGRILLELLDALAHAHALPDGACLLHLDLKPANVFLVREANGGERVKVLDFGISRFADASGAPGEPGARAPFAPGETTRGAHASGGLACTPSYCAPEQAARMLGEAGPALDARTDLYALGVLAYRALTGDFPQEPAPDLVTTLRWRRERAARPLAASGVAVPRALARFVEQCLALDPAARPASAQAARAELRARLAPRSRAWPVAVAACVAALGLALYVLSRPARPAAPLAVVVGATGHSATQEPLFFGPARAALDLELLDLPAGAEPGALRLLDQPRPGAAAVPGWSLRASGATRLELVADPDASTRAARGFLVLESGDETCASAGLELVYVAPGAWEVVAADIVGRGARAVDPRGQVLEVELRGPAVARPELLALELGARRLAMARDDLHSGAALGLYRVELPSTGWSAQATPRLAFEDRAGNRVVRALELPLVLDPLVFGRIGLEGAAQAGGRWHLLAGEPVELLASSNRPTLLAWELVDADGTRVAQGRSETPGSTHRLAIAAEELPASGFTGVLRLTLDEDPFVAHAPGSARPQAELELEVRATGAVFEASLAGARAWLEEGRRDPVHYLGAGPLRVAVIREHDVPMMVNLVLEGDGRSVPLRFQAPHEERKTVELALRADGRQRLCLAGQRLGPGGVPLEQVDFRRELELVHDTRAPRAELAGWSAGLVLRSAQGFAQQAFRVRLEDETFGPEPPPATVAWSLVDAEGGRARERATGELALVPGAEAVLEHAALASLPDGAYVLVLQARDFAGNEDEPRAHAFTVSAEGPRLEVLVPAAGEPWARASEAFTVELRAEDANGVARVECELVDELGALASLATVLAPVANAPAGSRWVGRFELDQRWSGRSVRLRVRGTDALGTESLRPLELVCTVGAIPSLVPAWVEVARPGRMGARMRRVPGNRSAPYVFGGRGDSLENAAFRARGLADYSSGALASSLGRECAPGSIADFYLDEHEVSVAQVLEFLRAPDGFADARHWDGSAPADARRDALERLLAAAEPTLPAVGLTCAEAQAFAAWAGKELPTYLHWEYAVRGLEARPYAFAGALAPAELGARVNVGTGAPWPVARGDDRTPDTLVANLCSNVAEWTSTPVSGALAATPVAELLAARRARPGTRHYVTGGSFARPAFHFGVIERRATEEASDAVGFRCMLPATRVEAAFLERATDLRVVPVR